MVDSQLPSSCVERGSVRGVLPSCVVSGESTLTWRLNEWWSTSGVTSMNDSERYECPKCHTRFGEFEEFAGIPGRCPQCRARLNGRSPTPDQSRLTDGDVPVDGGELPRPKKYSSASGDPRCARCGLSATKGYEGRTDFLDFCDSCFRIFGRWLNADGNATSEPYNRGSGHDE